MRTNLPGFALTVGMGLIVLLLGFGALSAAGLVSLMPKELVEQDVAEEQFVCCIGEASADTVAATAHLPVSPQEAAAIASGDALFKTNCIQCHAVNEKIVGPALARITKRRNMSWLVQWVQNPAKVIASGDEYAVKLFDTYGKQQMPSFSLSKKEIKDIVAWIESVDGGTSCLPMEPQTVAAR
jgi:mono/diheme cytochrome c family protein